MEFLDINFTKDFSLLLHAIHSLFYWRMLQKTKLCSGFKKYTQKNGKQGASKKNTVQEFHLFRRMLTNRARRHKLLGPVKIIILWVQKLKVKIYGY
jgi:hypothetical protein